MQDNNNAQENNLQEFEFDIFDTPEENTKSKRMNKRKWREIEAFKERQRERKVMDINDHYYSM
jgi:hypothetical protein